MPPKKPCAFLYPELLGPHFRLIYAYYGLKLHFKNMKTTININLMMIMPKRNLKMSWGHKPCEVTTIQSGMNLYNSVQIIEIQPQLNGNNQILK